MASAASVAARRPACPRSPADEHGDAEPKRSRPGRKARVRELVLHGDAHPAAGAARRHVRDLFVLSRRRRCCRQHWPARAARPRAAGWRDNIARSTPGKPPPALHELAQAVQRFGLKREDFLAVIDGMEMDVVADIRAPDYPTLELYCDRVACAVGRLSVKVFGLPRRRHRTRRSAWTRVAAH